MDREEILNSANKIGVEIVTLIFAYGINMISLYSSSVTTEGHWFARSGSLLVMFGAFLEFRNISFRQILNQIAQQSTKYYGAEPEKWVLPKKREILDHVVLFTLVYGTVVWGYGDLLFKNT